MLIREIMTTPAVSVHPDDWAAHAVGLLERMHVTHLPVVDASGRLMGLVGESELIGQMTDERRAGNDRHRRRAAIRAQRVSDLMARDVPTIRADEHVMAALGRIDDSGRTSLPVVLHQRVVGMVTRRDLINSLARGTLEIEGYELTGA